MSRVYRFHGPSSHPEKSEPVLLRKRKKGALTPSYLIAVDTHTITDKSGTRPIETYQAVPGQRTVTLTRCESDLIALSNPGLRPPVALEDLYPWLPEQRYLNDSASSFKVLKVVVHRFDLHFLHASEYCDEKWNTICNSIRQKSVLDARFYAAWHLPIQDVHVLEECRPNRHVISIDFNGMYPACMQQIFPKPSNLRLVRLDRLYSKSEILPSGLYRCIIDGPLTEFIINYNPFRSFHSGRHLRTRITEPVEVDLNEFEVDFYQRHFRSIHLIEAVISDDNITHPLAKEALRSFSRRQNYQKQGNKALADREKYLATLMTSCAHRPARPRRTFDTLNKAMKILMEDYGIDAPPDEPESATNIWLQGRKGIDVGTQGGLTTIQAPNISDGSGCFLLGQRIVAKGRIVLLAMMERILDRVPNVELCYTNIDSIHFSLPTEHLEPVLAWLNSECSDSLGSFKIESVTKHGLWLEPGRYWLYSDDVEKFRNRSVGNQLHPFKDHAIHVVSRKIGELHVPIKATIRMDRTISPSRSLITDPDSKIIRQRLIEIGNTTTFEEVLDKLEKNQKYNTPIRMAAFADLKERMSTSCFAASKQEDNTYIM